jgi:hypothetical protein
VRKIGGATLFGALTLLLAVTVGPIEPARADVGAPSWWSGDCDATHWNAAAAAAGWTGAGAHRLGAFYLGVPVCGPRPSVEKSPDVQWSRPGWGHFEWECTELAFRFMAQIYGVTAYGANGNTVVANYKSSYGGALVKITNGTVGQQPTAGDVISFDSPSGFGHVAVATASKVDAMGNGTVTVMTQNDSVDGWRTLTVTNWIVQPFGNQVPSGWLHDPAGRGGGPVTPTTAWYLRNTATPGAPDSAIAYGLSGATPVVGDWTGKAQQVSGTYQDGHWTLRVPSGTDLSFDYGAKGYVPVVGDWNGDGVDTVGVYTNGWWYLRNSNTPGPPDVIVNYGSASYTPVVGDWNGDGADTIGVYTNGWWYLRNALSAGTPDLAVNYGAASYTPIAGDWDGDGTASIGVFTNGWWYLRNTTGPGAPDVAVNYGASGYRPVTGRWGTSPAAGIGVVVG